MELRAAQGRPNLAHGLVPAIKRAMAKAMGEGRVSTGGRLWPARNAAEKAVGPIPPATGAPRVRPGAAVPEVAQ